MRRAGLLKTRRLRYWLLKYLAGRVGQNPEALVLESLPHRYRLIFPDILLEFFMPAPASLKLTPGRPRPGAPGQRVTPGKTRSRCPWPRQGPSGK